MKDAPPPPGPPDKRPPGWNPFPNEPNRLPEDPPAPRGASRQEVERLEERLADAEWRLEEQDRDIDRLERRPTARGGCGCWSCLTTLLTIYIALWLLKTFLNIDLIGMMGF